MVTSFPQKNIPYLENKEEHMKIRMRPSKDDPRFVKNALFYNHYKPEINFAIQDPLMLNCHPNIREEGIHYAKVYCSNSPLSEKASKFLNEKYLIEEKFSNRINAEKSFISSFNEHTVKTIGTAFLSTQKFFVPDSIKSPFNPSQTTYFSHNNLPSLLEVLSGEDFNNTPVVFIPNLCPINGVVDFSLIKKIKEKVPFFLIIEDKYSYGIDGIDGFGKKADRKIIDLLITHIPKSFGHMLTITSGKSEIIQSIFEHSFYHSSLFPPACYVGMLSSSLEIIDRLGKERTALNNLIDICKQILPENISIHKPLLTLSLSSHEEKVLVTKALIEKGFLLPSTSFNKHSKAITLHLNHQITKSSIYSVQETLATVQNMQQCEGI